MTATVLVVGASGSGKTTLIERVLPVLRARGLAVGTVKHASHGYHLDRPGSDSARHTDAGASPVVLVGPDRYALPVAGAPVSLATLVARHFRHVDLVLAEGFMSEPGPKVLVHRRGLEPRRPPNPEEVILAVTDEPLGYPRETTADDLDAVAGRLVGAAEDTEETNGADGGGSNASPGSLAVALVVDGRPVPMSDFVCRVVASTVVGVVSTLKGVAGEPREIELVVRRG